MPLLGLALVIATGARAQHQTLAGLTRDTHTTIAHTRESIDQHPPVAHSSHSNLLHESPQSRAAARALFVDSNLKRAHDLAARALRRDPHDAEALFVTMEIAAMEDSRETMLDAATRLCELGAIAPADTRVVLAAARIREAAANTPDFRAVIPRLEQLVANSDEPWRDQHAALLRAAMDGAPGLNPYAIARAAGIVTDWRMAGPLPQRPVLEFDQQPQSLSVDLAQTYYENVAVENFQFDDGWVRLPDYMSRNGVFYAVGHFSSLTAGDWTAAVEGDGLIDLYVDGERVLRSKSAGDLHRATFPVTPGPHRLLIKFAGSAAPLRVTVNPAAEPDHLKQPPKLSGQELAYLLAAADYSAGDFENAARQITAVPSAEDSTPLHFLSAQALMRSAPSSEQAALAWTRLDSLAPSVLAADNALAQIALANRDYARATSFATQVLDTRPDDVTALETITTALRAAGPADNAAADRDDLWARRIQVHPSCQTLLAAMDFFRTAGKPVEANAAEAKLNGCAPESLAYARALAQQGDHAASVRALQTLLAASPLDRAARLMLVRELQLTGDDAGAQRAAADWLHVAPNAARYHRLAAAADSPGQFAGDRQAFYQPYRRDAALLARETAADGDQAVILIDDHVAISRPDGSISLYVHTANRLGTGPILASAIPRGAQVLSNRVVHTDGSIVAGSANGRLLPGDLVDQEYVVHYAGDGGIAEHSEAFQFVFGSFQEPVLHARFVVLTPAERSDRGAVIATGDAPEMTSAIRGSWLERRWQMDEAPAPNDGTAVVRVVEQENGWTVPSSAEHQRRIETIHPKPLPEDS